jgi:hypothetical protein
VIAPLDQHIGDRLAQLQTLGDGEKMLLALGRGVLDQVAVAEPLRMNENRLGHFDVVIEGERADQLWRRALDAGQLFRQPYARLHFDIRREFLQNIIEQRDLVAGIAARAGRKQIGNPLQDSPALAVAPGSYRTVKFVDE